MSALLGEAQKLPNSAELKGVFKAADASKDGYLDKSESDAFIDFLL